MPTVKKVRSGVSFDSELNDIIGKSAEALRELGVTKSEVVNAVLSQYLDATSPEGIRKLVSEWRSKQRR